MAIFVAFIIVISLLFVVVIPKKHSKKIYWLFNLYWLTLIILTAIKPTGGHQISESTYFLLFLFLLSINAGFICGSLAKHDVRQSSTVNLQQNIINILKNRTVLLFHFVIFLVYIYYGVRYTVVIKTVGGINARNLRFFVGPLFTSTLELLIYFYIITPVKYLACFLVAMEIHVDYVKPIPTLIFTSIIILSSYIGGGRFELLYFLLSLLLVIIMKAFGVRFQRSWRLYINIKRVKQLSWILISLLGIILMAVFVTAFRQNQSSLNNGNFTKYLNVLSNQVINYNIGSIGAFDVALEQGIIENHFYMGRATVMGGIEELLTYILSVVGIPFNSARTMLGMRFNEVIHVGSATFNALFTALAYFYEDLGAVGVVIFSGGFGFCFGRQANRAEFSIMDMALFFHMFYQYMIMNLNWYFTAGESIMYYFLVFTLSRISQKRFEGKKASNGYDSESIEKNLC